MEIKITKHVEEFIGSLEKQTIAKTLRTIDLLGHFGHKLSMPHSKKVAKQLFELRVRGKQEVRIFYKLEGSTAVLLHAFVKKSQKTPKKELKTAIEKLKLN